MVILKGKKEEDIFDELYQQYNELQLEFDEEAANRLQEMATACHPRDKGGRYPMFIRVLYSDGEHNPPHAHLYPPNQKPTPKTLITKFLLTDRAPTKPIDIQAMRGKPPVPSDYAQMIIRWAKDRDEGGINNWQLLWAYWRGLEKTFKK